MDAKGIEPYSCWNWRRKTFLTAVLNRWIVFKIFMAKPIPGRQKPFCSARGKQGSQMRPQSRCAAETRSTGAAGY